MTGSDSTPTVVALVAGSHFVNHAYYMLLPPIFGALASDLGITAAQSGLALGVVGAVVVALQLPFGHLSDTRSRSLVLAVSLVVGTVGAALTATVGSYPALLVAAVVTGVGIAGHHPAHYPLLSAATDPGQRGRAFSIHGFAGALGFAAPPAVVGAATALGYDWRLAVGAVAAVGGLYAVGCLWTVRRRVPRAVTHAPGRRVGDHDRQPGGDTEPTSDDAGRSIPGRVLSGVRSTLSATPIVLLAALWFLASMANWGVQAYTAPLLTGGYGVGEGVANLVVSAMLVIGAVAILLGGWLADRYGARAVVLGGFVGLVAVAALLAGVVLPVPVALAVTLGFAATIKASRPALSKLGDALSAREDLGKNFGLLTVGISGGGAVAPPVFGALAAGPGVRTVFWAVAGLGVVAFLFTFVVLAVGERASAAGEAVATD